MSALNGIETKAAESSTKDIKKYVPGFDPGKLGIPAGNLDSINNAAMDLLTKALPAVPGMDKLKGGAPNLQDAGKNLLKGFGR